MDVDRILRRLETPSSAILRPAAITSALAWGTLLGWVPSPLVWVTSPLAWVPSPLA